LLLLKVSLLESIKQMEGFIPLNGSAGNSAPVGGRRHKLKLVTKKQARKMLKKLGHKLRGGADEPVVVDKALADSAAAPAKAGGKRTRRRSVSSVSRKMFGL
jgi:hypothetical protein